MANLPSAWQGYIQQEETKFKAADSEYTAQRTGANLNYLKDTTDTHTTQIGVLNTLIASAVSFAAGYLASGGSFTSPSGKAILAYGIYKKDGFFPETSFQTANGLSTQTWGFLIGSPGNNVVFDGSTTGNFNVTGGSNQTLNNATSFGFNFFIMYLP